MMLRADVRQSNIDLIRPNNLIPDSLLLSFPSGVLLPQLYSLIIVSSSSPNLVNLRIKEVTVFLGTLNAALGFILRSFN